MKKNRLNFWLLAALLCGLSLSVTSCKDDDDNNSSEAVEVQAVWAVGMNISQDRRTIDSYRIVQVK